MKLRELQVQRYGPLVDFGVTFDPSEPICVLMGHNGSGKSYLIECLVEVFRELDLGAPPPFAYHLRYECRGHEIEVRGDPGLERNRLVLSVDGEPISYKKFSELSGEYLPAYVFGYYSGWSPRLEHQFNVPTRRHYRNVLNSNASEVTSRRLLFCRKDYSQLVLLAFFLSRDARAHQLLAKYLHIRSFDSALFVLRTPWWGGGSAPRPRQKLEGDPRFWHALGSFTTLLSRMWGACLAPIRSEESVERDIRRQPEKTERLYLYIRDVEQLAALVGPDDSPKTMFVNLESLFLCDLIDEVRVSVEREDGTIVQFSQLSEGEQQLLTVIGLLLFTQDDDSLYLLDEPDTHLNPVWTYDFLGLIAEHVNTDKSQLLVATHNPLMVGSLRRTQVRVLGRQGEAVRATEPEYDPIGIGVEGLLKSDLYGLASSLPREVLAELDEHYRLLGITDRTPEQNVRLEQLGERLNALGVSRTHPNPYFEQFAKALARRAPDRTLASALTSEELKAETQLADELLAEIVEEEESQARGE